MNTNEEPRAISWIFLFLARTFFAACGNQNHCQARQNRYCIDCEMAACNHCLSEHADHRVIQIHRIFYVDVVSLAEISRHIDCSRIQPHASSNGLQILPLHPLPHTGSGEAKPNFSCFTCSRLLKNPIYYDYCSIACKFGGPGDGSKSKKTSNKTCDNSKCKRKIKQSSPNRSAF